MLSALCFSTCCWGTWMEKCVRKGVIVLKPVGWTWTRERRLTVWSLMTSGQVLAGWLLSTVLKTIRWDDSIKGNQPARKALVISQPASQAGRVQKEDTGEKEKHRREGKFRFLPGRGWWVLRGAPDTKLEHESYPECQIAVWLCVYCVNLAQMRHGGEYCLHNKWGHVQFSFHNAKQSHAKHVDIKKTLPGRQAATMFFSSSRPNDAVLAVKHSGTQSQITMNCHQQLPETTAVKQLWECGLWELRVDHLVRCRDMARWCQPELIFYSYSLSG